LNVAFNDSDPLNAFNDSDPLNGAAARTFL
jgi:hypothetical protein